METIEGIWRVLSPEEEIEFRQWARNNYTKGFTINSIWHPVVRDECNKMNNE
jgi:hypothetical protein